MKNGWIDYDTYHGICFDVVEINGQFNLQFTFLHYDEDDTVDDTFTIRTTSYTDTVQETASVIKNFIDLELFEHLDHWYDGNIFDEAGDVVDSINWQEYGVDVGESFIFDTTTPRVLH